MTPRIFVEKRRNKGSCIRKVHLSVTVVTMAVGIICHVLVITLSRLNTVFTMTDPSLPLGDQVLSN